MKLFNFLVGMLLICFASSISPTTINGRFSVIDIDGTKISVLLQINTDTGTDDLGGATIVFGFDTTAIGIPRNPIKDVDYVFHNFCGGNYSSATVTRPMKDKIWVNIDLPFFNNNNGTVVGSSPEWTNVVTIYFDILEPDRAINLSWLLTIPFWGIYDANNSTLWETGEFEDFPTSVEPISNLPLDYGLSQNYPNPFNPSTKIKFTIPSVGKHNAVAVQLKVYDILGTEVATLVDEEKAPGIYEVEFSTNNAATSLASGIYIYRIESAGFIETKKMVLLK